MKKAFIIAAGTALVMSSCGNSRPENSYRITGQVTGLPDSTVLVLEPLSFHKVEPVAEAMVVDGKFVFEGTTQEPMGVVLRAKEIPGGKTIILENADIAINGDVSKNEWNEGNGAYDMSALEITGSPLYDEYKENVLDPRERIDNAFYENQKKHADIVAKYGEARVAQNQAAMDSIKATDEYKEMEAAEKECFDDLSTMLKENITKYSNSIFGPLTLLSNMSYLTLENRADYELFSDSIKNTYHGKDLFIDLYPVGRPGDKMTDFEITDRDGNTITLSELCKDKKCVLLDFWASWCRPCRAEIPNLKNIYKKHSDKGFEIFSISIDTDDAAWRKALADEQLPWTNARDAKGLVADSYKVSAVPTMYLVDSEGRLVAENLRGEVLTQKIDEMFAD